MSKILMSWLQYTLNSVSVVSELLGFCTLNYKILSDKFCIWGFLYLSTNLTSFQGILKEMFSFKE